MHINDLPERSQDYLKTIYDLEEWGKYSAAKSEDRQAGATLTQIATAMNQRTSTASEAIKKLKSKGLIDHAPYGDIKLSRHGHELAVQMVRRHRLIETYLVQQLGYGISEVHEEAEVLEHAVSDLFIERIDATLGHPERDPHGDPIPAADGSVDHAEVLSLANVPAEVTVIVDRISDKDRDLVRYLENQGILPRSRISVLPREFAEMANIKALASGKTVPLPVSSLDAVLVRFAESADMPAKRGDEDGTASVPVDSGTPEE